jgi:hypothetical protein
MDFAIIWTTTKSYMPGTNAILNALEHYGFDVDVYVLTWDQLEDEYILKWPNVNFIPINTKWWPDKKANKWHLRFSDIIYTVNNLEYDVVLIWGADVCPVNNFMDYFEIAMRTDRVIVGTNEQCQYLPEYKRLSEKWPYVHRWDIPYADVPFFVPKSHLKVLVKMLEYQAKPDCELSHMDGMNYALRDLNTKVFSVPGETWIMNAPQRIKLQRFGDAIVFDRSHTRLNSFHRRYWAKNLCDKYLPVNETSRNNKMIFNKMWAWFNTDHRVKWSEGWEYWNTA